MLTTLSSKQKTLPTAHINVKLWITILLSTAIFLFQFEPLFLWFLLRYTPVFLTPHRPVYIKVYSPLGATDEPLNCIHDALLIREALSPLSALRGPGRTSRPSWIIILTPHTYSLIFRTSIQPLGLHLSIHQPTNMITVIFILRVYEP